MVHLWSLTEDVVPENDGEDIVLRSPLTTERVEKPSAVIRDALRRMELGPVLLSNAGPGPDGGVPRAQAHVALRATLEQLSHLVVRTLGLVDLRGPLLSVCPVTRAAVFVPARLPGRDPIQLPRTASLRRYGRGLCLERAGADFRVLLHRPEAAWVAGQLAWPATPHQVARAVPLPAPVTGGVLEYLAAAGMVVGTDPAA